MSYAKKKRDNVINYMVSQEEIEYVDSFCASSTRSDRMYALASIRREIKSIEKTVIEYRNNGRIRAECADNIQSVLDSHRQTLRGLSPSQQTLPEVTRQLMLNYRLIKNLSEEILTGHKIIVSAHEAIS